MDGGKKFWFFFRKPFLSYTIAFDTDMAIAMTVAIAIDIASGDATVFVIVHPYK